MLSLQLATSGMAPMNLMASAAPICTARPSWNRTWCRSWQAQAAGPGAHVAAGDGLVRGALITADQSHSKCYRAAKLSSCCQLTDARGEDAAALCVALSHRCATVRDLTTHWCLDFLHRNEV